MLTSKPVNKDPTGWREFIQNVIDGKNYFRAGEYMQLLQQLETVTRERDEALSKLRADETPAPINQCDGCRRGLPKNERGIHVGPGGFWAGDVQGCTAHLYSPEEPTRELSASEAASFDKTLARSPRRIPPREFDVESHTGLYPSDELSETSGPEKAREPNQQANAAIQKAEGK